MEFWDKSKEQVPIRDEPMEIVDFIEVDGSPNKHSHSDSIGGKVKSTTHDK